MSYPEYQEIKKGFDMFDVNGTGKIDPKELRQTMEEMGLVEKNKILYEIISSLDNQQTEENGGITFEEYCNCVQQKMSDKNTKEGIRRIFEFFNQDPDSDTIPLSVFVKVAKELKEDVTEKELKDLLSKTGSAGEELTFDEFYNIIAS